MAKKEAIKLFSSGKRTVIILALLFLVLLLYVQIKSRSFDLFSLSIPLFVIFVTWLLYFLIDNYFSKSSNVVVSYLRNLSTLDVFGVFIMYYSLRLLYDLIFNFYNVEIRFVFFISLFFTIIFGSIIFVLSLFGRRKRFLDALKESISMDLIYRLGIQDYNRSVSKSEYKRPKLIKIINSLGYALFILFIFLVLLTSQYISETEGVLETTNYRDFAGFTRYSGPSYSRSLVISMYTKDKEVVKFVLGDKATKEFEKKFYTCSSGHIVKIKHNPFAYSWPYFNEVVSCRL